MKNFWLDHESDPKPGARVSHAHGATNHLNVDLRVNNAGKSVIAASIETYREESTGYLFVNVFDGAGDLLSHVGYPPKGPARRG